jgi:subtilisin family serine protease
MAPLSRHLSRPFPWLAGLVVVAALFVLVGSAHAATQSHVTVVGYSSEARLRRAVARAGGTLLRRIPTLHVAELRMPPAAVRALEGLRGVRYAEQPVLREGLVDPGIAPASVMGGAYEWQYSAAGVSLVPSSVLRAASSVTVAVIDSGADVRAPDLAAKAPATWSVTSSSPDVTDYQGHGTFVSSLAVGSSTNSEGVAGFGGDAKLLAVQASSAGSFTDVDEAAAIVYAVDHGARVINMSFGGSSTSTTEQNAINYAVTRGVLLVAAAGNSGLDGNPPMYPAALLQPVGSNGQAGVGLAVAASTISGARASFSNYGSNISLAAPGQSVFGALSGNSAPSDWPRQTLPGSASGIYGYASGTSFSSPEVAGAAALVWAANPNLTAGGVAAVLKQTASGNGSWNQETGYGILNASAAVSRAQGLVVAPPTVTLTGSCSGSHLRLNWSTSNAASYRVTVARDGEPAQVLFGATTLSTASYDLEPGHTYSFAVSATDVYGATVTSAPFVVALPVSPVNLTLRASAFGRKSHQVRLWAAFSPADRAVARGGRTILLESFDGRVWRRFARSATTSTGVATWTMKLRRGTYRLRARFAGGLSLAAATSAAIKLQAR